ncbi:hypothetical protein [Flagellimonas sp.]|uniref:hypothetical protein n=1 Tax=Flagellimonas sp. TaxID=2058762 RepID=UPI003C7BB646
MNTQFGLRTENFKNKNYLNGRVKLVTNKKYGIEFKFGERTIGNQVGFTERYELDDEGYVSQITYLDSLGKEVERYEFGYDNNNNLKERLEYDRGELIEKIKYDYDSIGNRTKSYLSFIPTSSQSQTDYLYDESNKVVVVNFLDSKGNLIQRDKYSYQFEDDKNQVIKSIYHSNGELNSEKYFEFDNRGNLTVEYSLDKLENVPFSKRSNRVEKLFSTNGLVMITTESGFSGMNYTQETIYHYDSINNIIREEITRFKENDTIFVPPIEFEYVYDDENNWVQKSNSSFIEIREIEYH